MDYFYRDSNLDAVMDGLAHREERAGEDTVHGWKATWSKHELMDFAGWNESTYSRLSKVQKEKVLTGKGLILHELSGKGDATVAVVTITNYAWYHILLRESYRRSTIVEAYLHELFTGNGFMELGGVHLAATVNEFARKYATLYGETIIAAEKKLERIRLSLRAYGYLLLQGSSPSKQIRVRARGTEEWMQGHRAIHLDYQLRRAYALHYQEMDEKVPVRKDVSPQMRIQARALRKKWTIEFTDLMKKKYKLDVIRSHRMGVLSEKAHTDYNAIISLYMSGATFTEIRSFLESRPAYWAELAKAEKATKNNPRSMDAIMDNLFSVLTKEEE